MDTAALGIYFISTNYICRYDRYLYINNEITLYESERQGFNQNFGYKNIKVRFLTRFYIESPKKNRLNILQKIKR